MSKVADSVQTLVTPIAEGMGIEVVEVLYDKKYNGMNLTIFIDSDDGIDINKCEKFHRAILDPIDELDPIAGQYILNVSSLGIDRPLKTDRDYKRNMGKVISVKLYKADSSNNKQYRGELTSYTDTAFTIDCNGSNITFNRNEVAHVEPVIEF